MHFTNCRLWNFQSEMFNKLCPSYNTNLRIIYDFPYDAKNWIVEELSGGKHARQQMMSRYCIKFVESLHFHKSPSVSSLLTKLKDDVRSLVGSNLRLKKTNVHLIPGITKPFSICKGLPPIIAHPAKSAFFGVKSAFPAPFYHKSAFFYDF